MFVYKKHVFHKNIKNKTLIIFFLISPKTHYNMKKTISKIGQKISLIRLYKI